MAQVVRLFAQIALLRRGPQDLPASASLLGLTVIAYIGVISLVSVLWPPVASWPEQLAVEVLFTLGWYALLLQLVGRRERFLQTATAVFGFRVLLAPVLLASAWLMRRFEHDAVWQLPVVVAGLALFVWLVAVNSHVVRAALEWSSGASVGLVIVQLLTTQLLLLALFPLAG